MAKFQPGQSGNPGGRPKSDSKSEDIKKLAREKSERAIEVLAVIMEDNNAPAAARTSAANAILDRAYGKPPQALTGEEGGAPLVVKVVRFSDD